VLESQTEASAGGKVGTNSAREDLPLLPSRSSFRVAKACYLVSVLLSALFCLHTLSNLLLGIAYNSWADLNLCTGSIKTPKAVSVSWPLLSGLSAVSASVMFPIQILLTVLCFWIRSPAESV
jgi:hypothetical protein